MMLPARTLILTACAFAALGAPAFAETSAPDDGIEIIGDAEMDDLRGGFDLFGIEIGFGAVVTSTLNGVPVLTTQLTLTDTGSIISQTLSTVGQNLDSLTPEQLAALGVTGLDGMNGVVIDSESGITAFVHNVTNGTLQNIIVNTATGQEIGQSIDVTLTLPGFEYIQNQLMLEQFGMQLSDDLQSVAIGLHD
jgi:hypothetical protein